jgi:hypothetical protein
MRQSAFKSRALVSTKAVAAALTLGLALASATPAHADDDACPSARGTLCVEAIRGAVDRADYGEALELAEAQCEAVPTRAADERLAVEALVAQSSGCYWVYVLDRFLGRPLPALEARDKARRIATLGCEHGLDDLCEILLGLVDRQLDELLDEVRTTLRSPGAAVPRRIALRSFEGDRELPRGFLNKAGERLKATFKAEGAALEDCAACRATRVATTGAMTEALPATVLDARLAVEGADLTLTLKALDTRTNRVIWEKAWRTRQLAERQRLYGFDASVPESVATARRIEAWEPDYHVMAGLGVARLPNGNGGALDSQRLVLQIRAGERFHLRRTEVGISLSAHVTQRTVTKRYGKTRQDDDVDATTDEAAEEAVDVPDEVAAEDVEEGEGTELEPSATGFGLYGFLGRHLLGSTTSYDGMRLGATFGYGGYVTSSIIAPSARLSLEVYFGRRFAVSPAALWVGRAALQNGDGGEERSKPAAGSECVFSLNF